MKSRISKATDHILVFDSTADSLSSGSTERTELLFSKLYKNNRLVEKQKGGSRVYQFFRNLYNRTISMSQKAGTAAFQPLPAKNESEVVVKEGAEKSMEVHLFTLKCPSCSAGLENYLKSVKGVKRVAVNFATKMAFITYDSDAINPSEIVNKIKEKNHVAVAIDRERNESCTIYFKYDGKSNDSLHKMSWSRFRLSFLEFKKTGNFLCVEYDKREIGIRQVYSMLLSVNPSIRITDIHQIYPLQTDSEIVMWRNSFWISFVFALICMTLMICETFYPDVASLTVTPGLSFMNLVLFVSASIVQVIVGRRLFISAWNSLKISINMDFLISTASSISYIYSTVIVAFAMSTNVRASPHTFFETPIMLYMIVSLGRWIETNGKFHTMRAIKTLMKPQESKLEVLVKFDQKMTQYETEELNSQFVQENDYIFVYYGTKLSFDGIIFKAEGSCFLNESIISGESVPVEKQKFCEVYSGSINEGQPFIMKITRTGEDCRIQILSKSVHTALSQKLPVSNVVDVVSRYFTPTILVLSLLTFLIWTSVLYYNPNVKESLSVSSSLEFSLQTAISVLCVACPCALGLAIPLAVMIASGVGAKQGIFIKGGLPMQKLCKVNMICFDKTGTLTTGKPSVEKFILSDSNLWKDGPESYFSLIYALANTSSHVISMSIKSFVARNHTNLTQQCLSNLTETPGKGLKCEYEWSGETKLLLIGNNKLLEDYNVEISEEIKGDVSKLCTEGCMIVFCAFECAVFGYFVLKDEIRNDAYYTMRRLKEKAIACVMITGDRAETAKYVAQKLEIDNVYSQISPEQKNEIISDLKHTGAEIAMVGDGVNDSLALASSCVGISIGNAADLAIESSDIVITSNKLRDVLNIIELSRVTMRTISRNLVFSSVYNLTAVPIAAGCFKWAGLNIQPWIAAVAMVLSSLSVTGSSMLILWNDSV